MGELSCEREVSISQGDVCAMILMFICCIESGCSNIIMHI